MIRKESLLSLFQFEFAALRTVIVTSENVKLMSFLCFQARVLIDCQKGVLEQRIVVYLEDTSYTYLKLFQISVKIRFFSSFFHPSWIAN